MPPLLSKPRKQPLFEENRSYCFDFLPPNDKGWTIDGAKFERINGQLRPVIVFRPAVLETLPSPTDRQFAAALRLAQDCVRPQFVFMDIPDGHPFKGRQYCRYSPQWLRGTGFGKIMYEGDLIMKQLTHNVRVNEEDGSYTAWDATSKLKGLRTSFDFPGIPGRAPFYLSCKRVKVVEKDDSITFAKEPEMEIMVANNPGYWTYITSIYDSVAYHDTPVLLQVKELPKMILAAEWFIKKGVQIDQDWLWDKTQREEGACPTVQQMPYRSDDPVVCPLLNSSVDLFLEQALQVLKDGESQQDEPIVSGAESEMPTIHVDVNSKLWESAPGRFNAEITKSLQLNEETVQKVSCSIRAAFNDDDFVYGDLSPQMPLAIGSDGPIIPDVTSWKELKSETILPFTGGLSVKSDADDEIQLAKQQGWGGCSMRSFTTEPTRRGHSVGIGTPCGSSHMRYSNDRIGAVTKPKAEPHCTPVGRHAPSPSSRKSSFSPPPRDVSTSAPLASRNAKVLGSGAGQRFYGQQNPLHGNGYIQGERSGGCDVAKLSYSKTERVLEGPGKGNTRRECGAVSVPQLGTEAPGDNQQVIAWGSKPELSEGGHPQYKCSFCHAVVLSPDEMAVLECGDWCHEKCIEKWFKEGNNTCPECSCALARAG
eukprot:m.306525 g.306525  ORF g.306525 m.306525 type:complete len:650 (+) comp41331_c0_seq1:246-2195(+)